MSTGSAPALFENLGHALPTDYFFLREQLTEPRLVTCSAATASCLRTM
jgi:hypothetical protein